MSLADLQRALGTRVAAQSSPAAFALDDLSLEPLQLDQREVAWLRGLDETPGLAVTAHVARWWRETKLQMMARLTLMGLQRIGAGALVARYLDETACRTLFFLPEALGFLGFVAAAEDIGPVVPAIARFERALLEAREAAFARLEPDQPEAGFCEVVRFPAPAEAVLAALVSGEVLPTEAARPSHVEVSSALPQLWRVLD
ncbi:MAG TPA: hypothetical protein VGF45_21920 [Polyangia bacterium]